MFTETCRKCGWVSQPKATPGSAASALNCHNNRKHLGMKAWNERGFVPKTERGNTALKTKRKYTRRVKPEQAEQIQQSSPGLNFCPGCGCNLGKITLAMTVAERIK